MTAVIQNTLKYKIEEEALHEEKQEIEELTHNEDASDQ